MRASACEQSRHDPRTEVCGEVSFEIIDVLVQKTGLRFWFFLTILSVRAFALRPAASISQAELPVLPDQVVTETVALFFLDQRETGLLVNVPGGIENAVGPKRESLVAAPLFAPGGGGRASSRAGPEGLAIIWRGETQLAPMSRKQAVLK